jgi:hypothetical protein
LRNICSAGRVFNILCFRIFVLIFILDNNIVEISQSHPRVVRVPSAMRGDIRIAPRSLARLIYVDQVEVM